MTLPETASSRRGAATDWQRVSGTRFSAPSDFLEPGSKGSSQRMDYRVAASTDVMLVRNMERV